jgi:hypothetical protein
MISEPVIVSEDSITLAWRGAANLVVKDGDRFNLVVHIKNPAGYDEDEITLLNPRSVNPHVESVFDVANTIFPRGRGHESDSPADFCAHYKSVYERGRSRKPSAWGTYFQRMVTFGNGGKNQVLKIIDCMNEWKAKPRAAFVVHLSGAHLDNPRPLGAPCWQYGQFIRTDDSVLSLAVTYRSHDYFEKALGNFLGLARLLAFVCEHTEQTMGTLTCLSIYAHLGSKKAQTKALLAN